MQTIIVRLHPGRLENPDLDIRYDLPTAVEKYTNNRVTDKGYDYFDDNSLGIWLGAENAACDVNDVIELIGNERFCGNDLSKSAEIYISDKEEYDIEKCRMIYP